jgi:hypothetical protein
MATRQGPADTWHKFRVPLSSEWDSFDHYQPAVALGVEDSSLIAHVVWVRQDAGSSSAGHTVINYARCTIGGTVCSEYHSITTRQSSIVYLAPDVALDASGVPHVVWVQEDAGQIGVIMYNNRAGGQWGTSEKVSYGLPPYDQDSPTVAADGQYAYVAWDENIGYGDDAGIYFRRRSSVSIRSGSGGATWDPAGLPTGKQLSVPASVGEGVASFDIDGLPTIDVGDGWAYVMWQRLVGVEGGLFQTKYSYQLAYRVYTGTLPQDHWWPGGSGASEWATLPYVGTSLANSGDFYGGLQPSIQLVGKQPHVVWHQWYATAANQVHLSGDIGSEFLVSSQQPYKVSYAWYKAGTDPTNLPAARNNWVSKSLKVLQTDRILAAPRLAMVSTGSGTPPDLHVALLQRQGYDSSSASFAWDVWYTNGSSFHRNYLPVLFRRY